MYFCHVFCIRRALFEEVGGFRAGFEGCQDYDLALRLTERTDRIAHVPKVLYHWRALPSSTASSGAAKPEAFERGVRAVQEALDRRGIPGWVSRPDFAVKNHLGLFQIDFPDEGPLGRHRHPDEEPARARPQLHPVDPREDHLPQLRDRRDRQRERRPGHAGLPGRPPGLGAGCIRIPSVEGRFNYARLNNLAVEQFDHEYVLFLNNDTEVRRPEWLSQMVGYAQIPGVGAVGARLLFPDGRVQHAGVITNFFEGMPDACLQAHALVGERLSVLRGGHAQLQRGDGGLPPGPPRALPLAGRLRRGRGSPWRTTTSTSASASARRTGAASTRPGPSSIHHESASRGCCDDPKEPMAYRRAWGHDRDPYYNPNLTREHERFAIGTRRVDGAGGAVAVAGPRPVLQPQPRPGGGPPLPLQPGSGPPGARPDRPGDLLPLPRAPGRDVPRGRDPRAPARLPTRTTRTPVGATPARSGCSPTGCTTVASASCTGTP